MKLVTLSSCLFMATAVLVAVTSSVDASVYIPRTSLSASTTRSSTFSKQNLNINNKKERYELRWALKQQQQQQQLARNSINSNYNYNIKNAVAVAIPGYSMGEQIVVGGFLNFLNIYNLVITGRILLSWFPQAQSIGILQPVFAITDPYLNLFRGLIPPIFGLDLSPLLAFFLLNALTTATVALGAEIPNTTSTTNTNTNSKNLKQQRKSTNNVFALSPTLSKK